MAKRDAGRARGRLLTWAALVVLALAPWPATAQPVQAAGRVVFTIVDFTYTGAEQAWTAPAGVHSILVTITGAPGAKGAEGPESSGGHGGRGALVYGSLAVTPGQVLYVRVGGTCGETRGAGGCTGGFNGGGTAGGGGASDIRTVSGSGDPAASLASRLIVAGGGGGGSDGYMSVQGFDGGDAGMPGQPYRLGYACPFAWGGFAGTADAGGRGGYACGTDSTPGTDGALGLGGNGAFWGAAMTGQYFAGGGGGGYYGGGGGGAARGGSCGVDLSGGGGGSSLVTPGGSVLLDDTRTPRVQIEYVPDSDTTPPAISITAPADQAAYLLNQAVTPAYTCTDDGGSGVAACSGSANPAGLLDTATVGLHTFAVTATDNAGNTTTQTVSYRVNYQSAGFLPPVDPLNTGKAGRTYPIKWQLQDASGSYIGDVAAVKSITYAPSTTCTAGDTSDVLPESTVGDSTWRYDGAANQYIYNWKTPGSAGCYALVLTLASDQTFTTYFDLK